MKILKTLNSFRHWRSSLRSNLSVGLVPTMGALHRGHLSLVRRSKKDNARTVVSIFVNPIQFGPKEDLKKYPRPWRKDLRLLRREKVDVVFAPRAKEMTPPGGFTRLSVPGLNNMLCGSPRLRGPAHFDGVATIVAKLFNIVQPRCAYFGLKDYQQVRVIEQLVSDLQIP